MPKNGTPKSQRNSLNAYLDNYFGQQKSILDNYLKRAASASLKRGGSLVSGGPNIDTALQKQAIQSLAQGYDQAYDKAVDYDKYLKESRYRKYRDALADAKGSANPAYSTGSNTKALQSISAQNVSTYAKSVDALLAKLKQYETQLQSKTAAESAQTQLEKLNSQARQNQLDIDQRHQKQRDMDDFNQMTNKAALTSVLGQEGAGWTAKDDILMEYLGVKLGYLKPVDRKVTRKTI
jgi:hypothetical protein